MKVLLLDTCGAEGSFALAETGLGGPLVALLRLPGRMASERLVAMLREAMQEAGWKLQDLAAIAVVTGPGSFTGGKGGIERREGIERGRVACR